LQQKSSPRGTTDYDTLEQVTNESIRILKLFYQNLSKPHFQPIEVFVDSEPNPDDINENFQMIKDDLLVLFQEFENMESVILGGFNYMVSRLNRLNRKMKGVSSLLSDYILFSTLPTKDALFFTDSFNNLVRVEANSPLLTATQCEVNQVEGVVTLPVNRTAQATVSVTEVPVINSNSNGVVGNNHELDSAKNSSLSVILDNNPDTWFEYERVLLTDDNVHLVLDITINLGDPRVVNFLRINPNNFGTRTQIEVVSVDTSLDGKDYVSIKDDIPIAGFFVEDEENVFTLAPSTSKYAGQGLYSFTPRKIKFIRLQFKQKTSYVIETSIGSRFRYAIGIRDIEVQALPYETKGELISTEYTTQSEVRKVALLSNQRPDASTTSDLVSVRHYVSPDNGITWQEIRPLESEGLANADQTVPEILDYNGPLVDSIKTNGPVKSLRYKVVMERFPDAFTDDAQELAIEETNGTELHPVPTLAPFNLSLERKPIAGTMKVIDPNLGSRGDLEAKYPVIKGTGDQLRTILPFYPIKRDKIKDTGAVVIGDIYHLNEIDPVNVYVDGVPWTKGLSSGSTSTDEHYSLNLETGELQTGDGTDGKAVPLGSIVSVTLDEERLFPSHDKDHVALLGYSTANDKKAFKLEKVRPLTLQTDVLQTGANRHQLQPRISTGYTPVFSDDVVFNGELDFIDGSTEFTPIAGQYSIDYPNGVAYSYTRVSSSKETTVSYQYEPREVLTEDDWDFVNQDGGIANAVSIRDGAFESFLSARELVAYNTKYFGLQKLHVVKGSVKFTGTTSGYFDKEVPFIDGKTELAGVIKTNEKLASITAVADEIVVISFSLPISTSANFSADFTNTDVFIQPKANLGIVTTVGDYFVDRSNNRVHVKVAGDVADPGFVEYYFVDTNTDLTGVYSINYETGEVYTYTATPGSGCYVQYRYTDYRATYTMAREIPDTDWKLSTKKNELSIADREILKNARVPQVVTAASATKGYQLVYKYVGKARDDINELEPYFTPVLKDYSLKVITKDKLV
jgi:hypothetical protein